MKSKGTHITGEVISEDEHQLHLRDQKGIILVFKKAILDLKQMELLNKELPKVPPPAQTQPSSTNVAKRKPSLSDAIAKKTGKAKVLKLEDLEKTPELSIIGSEESSEEETSSEKTESIEEKPAETPGDEQYWRDRMKQLRMQVEELNKKATEYDIECERTGGRSSQEKAGSTYLPNTNCKSADDSRAQADAVEEEIRKLRLEGTVKDLPPEWFQE